MEWEYYTLKMKVAGFWGPKVETEKIDALLNEAGSQGWETVNVVGLSQSYGATNELLFVFKRQR